MYRPMLFLLCCGTACHAQLPDAPSVTKAWALNVGTNAKYSLTKNKWDSVPKVVLDYRFTPRLRVGLEYSHAVESGENAVALVLNIKLAEWGKKR